MGRSPCCAKEGLNRGAWTATEDKILTDYINVHGEGKWRNLPKQAGLMRCGKSCRLRWLNYLRPDIKRGNITNDEEELIIRLHKLLGNRWSLIAARLPGRTDNEIKNYWNTKIVKKFQNQQTQIPKPFEARPPMVKSCNETTVIRTKALRCTRVVVPQEPQRDTIDQQQQNCDKKAIMVEPKCPSMENIVDSTTNDYNSLHESLVLRSRGSSSSNLTMDCEMDDQLLSDFLNIDFSQPTVALDFTNGAGRGTSDFHDQGDLMYESEFPSIDPLVETEFDWLGD